MQRYTMGVYVFGDACTDDRTVCGDSRSQKGCRLVAPVDPRGRPMYCTLQHCTQRGIIIREGKGVAKVRLGLSV